MKSYYTTIERLHLAALGCRAWNTSQASRSLGIFLKNDRVGKDFEKALKSAAKLNPTIVVEELVKSSVSLWSSYSEALSAIMSMMKTILSPPI